MAVHVSKFCAILYMDASRHSVPPNGSRAHEALLFDYEKTGEPGGAFLPSGGQHHTPGTAGLRRERWCV